MQISDLKVENMVQPLGIDTPQPVFSYILLSEKRNTVQVSYTICVEDEDGHGMWNSGTVWSDQTHFITYEGNPLKSITRYRVRITSADNYGEAASADTWFETAFMNSGEWRGKWVVPQQLPAYTEVQDEEERLKRDRRPLDSIIMRPAQYLRQSFQLSGETQRARAYVTAHGVYSLYLNGQRVGDQELAPGYTSYPQFHLYQIYDITQYLLPGENVLGMIIGDGWYLGKVGLTGDSCQFGTLLAGLFELHVVNLDGTEQIICSGEACTSSTGAIISSDLFVGEKYDARLEQRDFSTSAFQASGWLPVQTKDFGYRNLRSQYTDAVKIVKRFLPAAIVTTPAGETVLDTGQVLAGRVQFKVSGPRGSVIVLEHSETLDQAGNFINNIYGKFSQQTDVYILKGEGEEVYSPSFTYHGFRYVRITGWNKTPSIEDFEIQVISSAMDTTIEFECSDQRLNRLQQNVMWSQLSNMVSIPTDCPQREKSGWTGDVSIFSPTACMNMDSLNFFKRWLVNVRAEQLPDGQIPLVVPNCPSYDLEKLHPGAGAQCSAGWGDVIITLPLNLYYAYGDIGLLKSNYPAMKHWMQYVRKTAEEGLPENLEGELTTERLEWQKYLWNTNFHYGDWLTPSLLVNTQSKQLDIYQSARLTKDIVPTCFYAYSAKLISDIAQLLGYSEDAQEYQELNRKIKDAFQKEFLNQDGSLKTNLQGIYVLALAFHLLPEAAERPAFHKLVELIEINGNRLDTGFLSVPFLLPVLHNYGRTDLAYELLFQEECPSWLYEVRMGATTIWEAWQNVFPDGTPIPISYNHYAFGCVAEWMYRNIGGIRYAQAGYKKICIAPIPEQRITSARTAYKSIQGEIVCDWRVEANRMFMKVILPANTSAEIILPGAAGKEVLESGRSVVCNSIGRDGVLAVGSGRYDFSYPYSQDRN